MFNNSALKDVVSGGNRMGLDLGILELFSHLHDSIRCSCPGQPLPVSCSCAIQGLLRGTGMFPTLVESFQQLLPSGIPLEEQFQAEENRAVPRPPPSSDPVELGTRRQPAELCQGTAQSSALAVCKHTAETAKLHLLLPFCVSGHPSPASYQHYTPSTLRDNSALHIHAWGAEG